MKNILIVDPDSASERLGEVLTSQGYLSVTVQDARAATSILQSAVPVDLVISETWLPDMDGMDFLSCLRRTNPALPVIVVTTECSVEKYLQAVNLGVVEYLTKPLYLKEVLRVVRIALGPAEAFRGTRDLGGKNARPFLATSSGSSRA
jgi:two-component system nitrogen regulation response regulator NtrX